MKYLCKQLYEVTITKHLIYLAKVIITILHKRLKQTSQRNKTNIEAFNGSKDLTKKTLDAIFSREYNLILTVEQLLNLLNELKNLLNNNCVNFIITLQTITQN